MSQLLISIFGFLVAISVLVAVHEWGHFFVARRFGIKVIRFSIGFGRPFLRWYDKLGTEYVLSMIPLGGYVALYGERDTDIPESQRHQAFTYKPLGARMLVLAAGPLANLLFAVAAYWLMFMIGIASVAPVIGNVTPGSIADLAGLKPREEIVSIEHKPTESWEAVSVALVGVLGSERTITVDTKTLGEVSDNAGSANASSINARTANTNSANASSVTADSVNSRTTNANSDNAISNNTNNTNSTNSTNNTNSTLVKPHTLDLSSLVGQTKEGDLLKELGITPLDPYPPVIGNVMENYPAANAGLQAGDLIVSVDGHPVFSRADVTEKVIPSMGETLTVNVIRNKEGNNKGNNAISSNANSSNANSSNASNSNANSNKAIATKPLSFKIQPVSKRLEDGKIIGFAGIEYDSRVSIPKELMRQQKYGPWPALQQAAKRTFEYTILTLSILKKMVMGSVSVKHLSGPIAIAQYAGHSVSIGFEYFLGFLAVISISLGVLNLLPIPLLDGGHLLYCFYELITGKRVSEHAQSIGMVIGGVLLLTVMVIAFYNDIVRF